MTGTTPRRHRLPGGAFEGGFSLLEVLVAFSILALSLGVLMQIFSTAMRNADLSEQYSRAALLAQSRLSAAGNEQPLQEGETEGEFEGGVRWRQSVVPYEEPNPEVEGEGAEAEAESGGLRSRRAKRIEGYRVTVEVHWEDGDRSRGLVLESLRIASPSRRLR